MCTGAPEERKGTFWPGRSTRSANLPPQPAACGRRPRDGTVRAVSPASQSSAFAALPVFLGSLAVVGHDPISTHRDRIFLLIQIEGIKA